MFTDFGPYPGFYDIIIEDVTHDLGLKHIVFHGEYYNEFSGNAIKFKTIFTFSATNHILKVETLVGIHGRQRVVGKRFMMKPDTENQIFFR